ncbi:MlaE family ABC transporter permease [Mycobacteroides franklinii]|uniref:ABC transporter permease n=1 Tax=Mycobacteroides franklinii TaxID=948102 RepID=A0A4R5PC88_9MYCO|nr:ABC transporter permease [Mycobacteroides franklinii]ORA63005.1 ABC transporter permease [Mycobacteroides franklinii]TDH22413.1 ABC transporter permease [Mycobacteroides franklinii]TDZ44042.1 putative phospholipid ABC transporter permease protein MlaE [Mycobacteroides franklinii]TDZ51176.1 putative phospholipid ABC transporter permease protein MlaE [Mycobacteroides franklinii]TDZ57596.1 putative phospholipid ABC transporter permease protein MlaE [Mycobacteroides franklinii]
MTTKSHRSAVPSTYFSTVSKAMRFLREPFRATGQWAAFIGQTFWLLPITVRRYRRETLQVMNNLAWGRGSLIVDGGSISVLAILGVTVGAIVAIEAFATLDLIGLGALSSIISGWGNVREMAPLVAGVAFASQAGCRMTAEIGSMRIADEIDATEAMGLRSIPFVVGTRLVGGLMCVIPGFLLTLVVSFLTCGIVIRTFYHQPEGTYNHYFVQFLTPADIGASLLKATVYCTAVTVIHCYYGYFASGGPVGVGEASGRAIRSSLVTIMVLDLATTIMLWGLRPQFVFRG